MYIIVEIESKKITGVTSDEDPFKFMDVTTGSNFESKPFTTKEDIYFKLRYKGILRFSSKTDIPGCEPEYNYYIIDPYPDPNDKPRDFNWETTLLFMTGYDPIELKREAKIEIINN